ncbi:MAG: FKBP-type peptidyl-prolyl cis-trans isomerase [Flaviaesturariibacter sp.]|nr:FKBP-type peptidyl-prolyl cis-trans isomerase [Flaviaesturariibacter sp.]
MKRILLPAAILSLGLAASAQTKKPAKAPPKVATASTKPLKSRLDSLSYAFGISLGSYLKGQDISNINYTLLNKAIEQTLKGQPTYMDANTANMCMTQMGAEKQKKKGEAERAAGLKFLSENKKKPGIITTASGLQYEIITKGTGPIPAASDTISAHYRGTLLNGKEFDNSYQRGQPLTIPVSGVIRGWTEALQLMPVGSKWKLYIPSELAYGEYGAGQDIPGGATLVFEVELLGIVNKK